MKKWIPWKSIVVIFVIIVIFLGVVYFFAESFIKKGIETAGTTAVGAKVELADLDLSLFPLGMTLNGLQVTNPKKPMYNAVEVGLIDFLLETSDLFQKKINIREMAATGIRFDTQRKESGAIEKVEKQAEDKTSEEKSWLPQFDIKDIQSVLQKEKLETLEEVNKLKTDIEQGQKDVEAKMASLPNQKTFEQHKAKIEEIKSGAKGFQAILGKAKDIQKLKKDIEKDIDSIKNAKKDIDKRLADLKTRIKTVSQSPAKDFNRLKEKYSMTSQGLSNITQLILGPEYSEWVTEGLYWYGKLEPYLEKSEEEEKEPETSKKVDKQGKEEGPGWNFLIQKAAVSLEIPRGDIAGTIRNITNDQQVIGVPMTFELSGKKLKDLESVAVDGEFNHVVPAQAKETINGKVSGYQVRDIKLSDSDELSLALKKATIDVDFQGDIKNKILDSDMKLKFTSVNLSVEETEKTGQVAKAIGSALAGVTSFSANAKVTGPLDDFNVKLSSDIDQIIKKAISGMVQKLQADFQEKLKQAIADKTNGPLKSLTQDLGGFDGIQKEIQNRLNLGNGVLGDLTKIR